MCALIDSFIDYLRTGLNCSFHTVKAYGSDLEQWAHFATGGNIEALHPEDVTTSDLRTWIGEVARGGASAATIKRKASALRSFYRYLMRCHGFPSNPASALILPRLPHRLPVYVRPEETEAILGDCVTDDFISRRNRLILDILYNTGIRCSELRTLRDADVDTVRGELKVLGKRNKERLIPFGRELAEAIDDYRLLRDHDDTTSVSPSDRDATLIVGRNGEPLCRKTIYNVVHGLLSEGGAHAVRLSPHVMRHSMATDMLNAGAPLASVQQLLGHASLASTQVYTHVTYRDLKNNYQLAHPRALKKGGHYGH